MPDFHLQAEPIQRLSAPLNDRIVGVAVLYPPLESVTAPNVPTDQAAFYLGRKPQTLRIWAMGRSKAPIKPLNIGGRLAWPTAKLRELAGV